MAPSAAGKEWRGHVEQTKKHEEAIQAALPVTTTQLALIGNEASAPSGGRIEFYNAAALGLQREGGGRGGGGQVPAFIVTPPVKLIN